MFVDPSGLYIKISGTEEEQNYILEQINKLTRDVYKIEDGYLKMAEHNETELDKYCVGTELIYQLCDNKEFTCEIKIGERNITSYENPLYASYGGSSSTITLKRKSTEEVYVVDENGNQQKESSDVYIALGHELIHALRAMKGNKKDSTIKREFYDAQHNKCIMVAEEELDTIGVQYVNRWGEYSNANTWFFTENALRWEHGQKTRIGGISQ